MQKQQQCTMTTAAALQCRSVGVSRPCVVACARSTHGAMPHTPAASAQPSAPTRRGLLVGLSSLPLLDLALPAHAAGVLDVRGSRSSPPRTDALTLEPFTDAAEKFKISVPSGTHVMVPLHYTCAYRVGIRRGRARRQRLVQRRLGCTTRYRVVCPQRPQHQRRGGHHHRGRRLHLNGVDGISLRFRVQPGMLVDWHNAAGSSVRRWAAWIGATCCVPPSLCENGSRCSSLDWWTAAKSARPQRPTLYVGYAMCTMYC